MKTSIKKIPTSQTEMEVELSPEEFNGFIEKAVFELGKDLEMEGFRKGKAPKEIIEKRIPEADILVKAADMAIKKNYPEVVRENNLEPISEPDVDILKLARNNPFIFRVKAAVLPEISLPDYKKIASEAKKGNVGVEEKEIEESLKWLQKSRAKLIIKNESAQRGDFVEIEYWAEKEEDPSLKQKQKDAFVLGEGHFIEGFENNLEGMKAGEEKKDIEAKISEKHFTKDLAGKKISLNVKMILVQKMELPEINDSFVKNLGNFENLESLKKAVREGIIFEKERQETDKLRAEILEKISQKTEFEIPEILIKQEEQRMTEDFKNNVAKTFNISFEDYLAKINKTEKDLFDGFSGQAAKKIKNFLILRGIGKKENFQAQEEEIKEEVNRYLNRFAPAKKAETKLDPERIREYTKSVIINEKTFKFLESFAKKQ